MINTIFIWWIIFAIGLMQSYECPDILYRKYYKLGVLAYILLTLLYLIL